MPCVTTADSAFSLRKHPHDVLDPSRRAVPITLLSSPQLQRHNHRFFPEYETTVQRPNTLPVISFNGEAFIAGCLVAFFVPQPVLVCEADNQVRGRNRHHPHRREYRRRSARCVSCR